MTPAHTGGRPPAPARVETVEQVDVLVVGGGVAGLAAALVLARAGRRCVVVDGGDTRNAAASHAHGFLTRDGVAPEELLRLGRGEVEHYGGTVRRGSVDAVVVVPGRDLPAPGPGGAGFEVRAAGGEVWRCRALVVATGLKDELPRVPGLGERWGRDVLHCPYCHGREVADVAVAVLATSAGSAHQALLVRQWCGDTTLVVHDVEPDPDDLARLAAVGVDVRRGPVTGLDVGDDGLRGLRLHDGTVVPARALFVGPVFRGTDALLLGLGATTRREGEGSWVVVDDHGRTSVPGLYAAGNVVDPAAQLLDAAAAGSRAGVGVNGDLVDADVAQALSGS